MPPLQKADSKHGRASEQSSLSFVFLYQEKHSLATLLLLFAKNLTIFHELAPIAHFRPHVRRAGAGIWIYMVTYMSILFVLAKTVTYMRGVWEAAPYKLYGHTCICIKYSIYILHYFPPFAN